jgi:hypothetical protein
MTIKLFEPLICADPEACVLEAYRHALFGGQAFIMRRLAGVAIGHLIDGDVLRLNMTAQRLIRGKFRLMPQIGGLYRLDFMGEAFAQIMREVEK